MFLSTTRLGLIACGYLAENYIKGGYVSVSDIADKYNINEKTLMVALRKLEKKGILLGHGEGNDSSFKFAEIPQKISALDVVTVLEDADDFTCTMETNGLKCGCTSTQDCELFGLLCNR